MIPSAQFFQQYYEYVVWADLRQLQVVRGLPDADYHKNRGFSFGSIHGILRHELAAQLSWLNRFEGRPNDWRGEDPTIDSLDVIERLWTDTHANVRRFMASLTAERLASTLHYDNTKGKRFALPLWQALFHMCQHSYYHRSQLNSMIGLAGGKPLSVDYQIWAIEKQRGEGVR